MSPWVRFCFSSLGLSLPFCETAVGKLKQVISKVLPNFTVSLCTWFTGAALGTRFILQLWPWTTGFNPRACIRTLKRQRSSRKTQTGELHGRILQWEGSGNQVMGAGQGTEFCILLLLKLLSPLTPPPPFTFLSHVKVVLIQNINRKIYIFCMSTSCIQLCRHRKEVKVMQKLSVGFRTQDAPDGEATWQSQQIQMPHTKAEGQFYIWHALGTFTSMLSFKPQNTPVGQASLDPY